MLTLSNLSSPKGSHRNTKRIGRGQGSGQGTQAGKGHKGQKARKSGHVRSGFEGNNLPLYMRLPKRGFSNAAYKTNVVSVTLNTINNLFAQNETVSAASLLEKRIVSLSDSSSVIKVIGNTKLDKQLNFSNDLLFTAGAKSSVEVSGSKIV